MQRSQILLSNSKKEAGINSPAKATCEAIDDTPCTRSAPSSTQSASESPFPHPMSTTESPLPRWTRCATRTARRRHASRKLSVIAAVAERVSTAPVASPAVFCRTLWTLPVPHVVPQRLHLEIEQDSLRPIQLAFLAEGRREADEERCCEPQYEDESCFPHGQHREGAVGWCRRHARSFGRRKSPRQIARDAQAPQDERSL